MAFGGEVVVLDEPTAALGVREPEQVLGASGSCVPTPRDHTMPEAVAIMTGAANAKEERA
ncbi:hypothetical protein [Nonomuraea sp. MG754425]|uniref:hypothetical protein n=1 Tax=Nonomuraea sp. MG754425 TaxID=2570319 RepID=UPI0027E11012|nr:hypothetical protein [Nonomuraea sp. MG754425]